MPKVSVIVPIFGVERYIERCARSLFEQTLEDIEYIFVNDCTKDKSIYILEKVIKDYPNRKNQIVILHHSENKGLPSARKTGIEYATGDYIIHCDSDDWVDVGMYGKMLERAEIENADMVVCDFISSDGKGNERQIRACYNAEKDKFIEDLLFRKSPWSLWNKMFRKSIYSQNIVFPKSNMGEDMALCSQLVLKCERIAYISVSLYYYFCNPQSITNSLNLRTVLKNFYNIKENTDIVINSYRIITNKRIENGLIFLQYNAKSHLFPIIHKSEYRRLFLNTYPNLFLKIFFCTDIPCLYKIKYIFSFLGLYPRKING